MVANIVHEWLHLLGFLHGEVNMREEVPYVVGSIAGQVAEEYLAARGIAN
jgi:ssRNA-specific RNase YbeY (16S rRNA maturation enzyme)